MRTVYMLSLWLVALTMSAQEVKLLSFNIRYDNSGDGIDQWSERKTDVLHLLDSSEATVIGLQEALYSQVQFLDSLMPELTFIGVGRDDGDKGGELSPIFYDSTRLALMDFGTFWLSPTPNKVSKGWDAALPRVCTFAIFKEAKTEKIFWVYNTHFDHMGKTARLSSAAIIVQHMYKNNISKSPVILMGDLNALPNSRPLELLSNHFEDPLNESTAGTFWGFNPEAKAENRIDYIMGKGIEFTDSRILFNRRPNGRHISDHLPVFALFSFEE